MNKEQVEGNLINVENEYLKTEEQYKLTLENDPNDTYTRTNYGVFLYENGRYKASEEQYKLVLGINPKNILTLHNYGILLEKMGCYKEAEEQYRIVLDADPKNVAILINYGILLYEMGRYKEAEEQYKLALESDPKNKIIRYNYGLLLKKNERYEAPHKMIRDERATPKKLNPKTLLKPIFQIFLFLFALFFIIPIMDSVIGGILKSNQIFSIMIAFVISLVAHFYSEK